MSEEEKKAIERIEDIIYKRDETNYGDDREITLYEDDIQKISKLLNLIEKQQRIMKSQEKIITEQEKEIDNYKKQEFGNLFNGRYISKDKIREKIKEYREQRIKLADGHFFDNPDNTTNDYALFIAQEVLKQLLEE